jgi:Glyoxalase-like domain
MIKLDHLVIAALTLEQGTKYVKDILGSEPYGGGRHLAQDTHNKIMRLGDDVYLEVIAPDPASDIQPKWFSLNDAKMLETLAKSPRLITYVAQTDELEILLKTTQYPLTAKPAQRDNLRWYFGFSNDGNLLADGLLPNLIQWESTHPAWTMKDSACHLVRLQGVHPEVASIQQTLQGLGFADITLQYGETPKLKAVIKTLDGLRVLE